LESTEDNSELSRHERKKLRKQQFKEEQGMQRAANKKSKWIKSSIIGIIALIVLIGIFFLVNQATKLEKATVDDDPSIGPTGAVTVIEFGDYRCPYTKAFNQEKFNTLLKEYEGRIQWVYRDMPIPSHENSHIASQASECARDQNKFWEYHNLLFQRSSADRQSLLEYARELGLDAQLFGDCLGSGKYRQEVNNDYNDGLASNVRVTPTFFINDRVKLEGDVPLDIFRDVLNKELSGSSG